MKLISVVIPCYNQGAYIDEAVESVLAQSYPHFEIVIVNDGSTDDRTNELLQTFNKPSCKVLHTENHGLPAARNTGIESTKGELICCLDADDKYHPDYFQKAVNILDQDTEQRCGAVPAWVQLFGSSNALWKTIGHNTEGFAPFLQGVRNNIQSATLFRKICWERIGGFDESMTSGYEDWDFWLKMIDLGYEWYCLEEPLIYYRQKEQSMVTEANEIRSQIMGSFYKKHNNFYAKYMIPILEEMDQEVYRLKKENMKMIKSGKGVGITRSFSSLKNGLSNLRLRFFEVMKK